MKKGGPIWLNAFLMKLFFIHEGDIITIAHFISHELGISIFSASNTTLSTLGEKTFPFPIASF